MFETNDNGEVVKVTDDNTKATSAIEMASIRCEPCDRVFKRAQDLKTHTKKMHKVVNRDTIARDMLNNGYTISDEPQDSDVEEIPKEVLTPLDIPANGTVLPQSGMAFAAPLGTLTPFEKVEPDLNVLTNGEGQHEHIVIKDSNGIPVGEIPQEAIIPNTIVHELKEDTAINVELNGIIDSLWMKILDGASRAIILSYMDSKMETNKALIEIANRLIDGNEKAIILQYVKN